MILTDLYDAGVFATRMLATCFAYRYIARFADVENVYRRLYMSMVGFLDDAVGEIVAELQRCEMWDNTLFVFSSDNGGPVYFNGTSGANNYPLRGGKMSNFEGGIRVPAFAAGGVLPERMHGAKLSGLVGLFDWYATFADAAGISAVDERAAAAGL